MRTAAVLSIVFSIIVLAEFSRAEEAYPVRIDFNQRVEMRDGVELSADVYRPDAEGHFPVILSRTPYNKNSRRPLDFGNYFAPHGYVYVEMDVRGRGDSDGIFVPYRNDGIDGYDAIEWCAKQPWSDGRVGTIGGSYLGRIQYLTAIHQPPHLTTMIAMVTPSDPFVEFPTGLPIPMGISWYHYTAGRMTQNMGALDWSKIHLHLPIYTMDEAAGRPNPYWKETIDHAKLDEWWEPLRYQDKYDRVLVPALHVSGWYDDEQIGTPLNFIGMTTEGRTEEIRRSQKLLMGPWPHGILRAKRQLGEIDFGPTAVIDLEGYFLRWFDYWLKEIDNGIMDEPPVRIFVMGENRWVDENEWPMTRTKWTKYYLHSGGRANSLFGDGRLSIEKPAGEPSDGYTYDPADPVPFITDPEFRQIGGPDDYRPVERRDDVLAYTSPVLDDDVTVCGPVLVTLYAASSAPDTDFMAKLLDVWPNGFAQRLTDGMVRARFRNGMDRPSLIEAGRVYSYDIDLWNTCQTFEQGHRIRLEITSSAFPKYDRNPNTGEELGKTTRVQIAKQTIYHDSEHASHVLLPIVPNE
jgi:putative CocE/NonD family hydrolase